MYKKEIRSKEIILIILAILMVFSLDIKNTSGKQSKEQIELTNSIRKTDSELGEVVEKIWYIISTTKIKININTIGLGLMIVGINLFELEENFDNSKTRRTEEEECVQD